MSAGTYWLSSGWRDARLPSTKLASTFGQVRTVVGLRDSVSETDSNSTMVGAMLLHTT